MTKGRMDMKRSAFALAAFAAAVLGPASAEVSCRVEPDYSVRLADKAGEAYVKVTLAADKVSASSRPSVNLAIVLDRSGSMHGDKIVKAREAACEAIPPSSRDEGLRLLHGLETSLATSLQTPQEA